MCLVGSMHAVNLFGLGPVRQELFLEFASDVDSGGQVSEFRGSSTGAEEELVGVWPLIAQSQTAWRRTMHFFGGGTGPRTGNGSWRQRVGGPGGAEILTMLCGAFLPDKLISATLIPFDKNKWFLRATAGTIEVARTFLSVAQSGSEDRAGDGLIRSRIRSSVPGCDVCAREGWMTPWPPGAAPSRTGRSRPSDSKPIEGQTEA